MGNHTFNELRSKYKTFIYEGFTAQKEDNAINITYNFKIENLCEFHPTIKVNTANMSIINPWNEGAGYEIIFSMGLVELVSYWKSACCPKVKIECGALSEEDKLWWKKLYFNGLGEFFYRNSIETDFGSFMEIECAERKANTPFGIKTAGLNLIPVGGGKDSNVTLELLSDLKKQNRCYMINPGGARSRSAACARYDEDEIFFVKRTIDRELLELNRQGFLNGHTPFSAVVAFSALYCAYLSGGEYIILSNESSANEANISGTEINHQYSKSYEFEQDFRDYVKRNITDKIYYFSLLRPFSELQIAKMFTKSEKYFDVFQSCNLGSKTDVWCADCPKCLFVYSILSPFIEPKRLAGIFGRDMLDAEDMTETFKGLVGLSPVKPFECVGTVSEIVYALSLTAEKYKKEGLKLPVLLKYFSENFKISEIAEGESMLSELNSEHAVPEKFKKYITEMYNYVSASN